MQHATSTRRLLVQFTKDFPVGYDLADDIPSKLYSKDGVYWGPEIEAMLHPATWAAYSLEGGSRKGFRTNQVFVEEWNFIAGSQIFVHNDFPNRRFSCSEFNSMYRRFSDVDKVSDIHQNNREKEIQTLAYEPSRKPGVFSIGEKSSFNAHTRSTIKANNTSEQPFLEFLQYLVTDERDREQLKRWIATLIAKPEIRMAYSILLISEMQGTGKTTLVERILAPLVGEHNVSFPSERMIISEFNSWAGFKRLVVISEIYQGNAWKAYNILKSLITDKCIEVNEKHKAPVTLNNWAHIAACSNSLRALKIDQDDRRWLVPQITETPWQQKQFEEFYSWLQGAGLGAIKSWAESYGDYVKPGEQAPMSEPKKQMIHESRSQFVQDAITLLEPYKDDSNPRVVSIEQLKEAVSRNKRETCYDRPLDFKRALVAEGWFELKGRYHVKGKRYYVVVNLAAHKLLRGKSPAETKEILGQHLLLDLQLEM